MSSSSSVNSALNEKGISDQNPVAVSGPGIDTLSEREAGQGLVDKIVKKNGVEFSSTALSNMLLVDGDPEDILKSAETLLGFCGNGDKSNGSLEGGVRSSEAEKYVSGHGLSWSPLKEKPCLEDRELAPVTAVSFWTIDAALQATNRLDGVVRCVDCCETTPVDALGTTDAGSSNDSARNRPPEQTLAQPIGNATVFCCGTELGSVLFFDRNRHLCGSIRPSKSESLVGLPTTGAAVSVALSRDGTYVIVGYECGLAIVWHVRRKTAEAVLREEASTELESSLQPLEDNSMLSLTGRAHTSSLGSAVVKVAFSQQGGLTVLASYASGVLRAWVLEAIAGEKLRVLTTTQIFSEFLEPLSDFCLIFTHNFGVQIDSPATRLRPRRQKKNIGSFFRLLQRPDKPVHVLEKYMIASARHNFVTVTAIEHRVNTVSRRWGRRQKEPRHELITQTVGKTYNTATSKTANLCEGAEKEFSELSSVGFNQNGMLKSQSNNPNLRPLVMWIQVEARILLCCAWPDNLSVYSIDSKVGSMALLGFMSLSTPLVALSTFSAGIILAINTTQDLLVIDAAHLILIDRVKLRKHVESLPDVNRLSRSGPVLSLSTTANSIVFFSYIPWEKRVARLVTARRWTDALNVICDVYSGAGRGESRVEDVLRAAIDFTVLYIDAVIQRFTQDSFEAVESCRCAIIYLIRICSKMKKTNMFFSFPMLYIERSDAPRSLVDLALTCVLTCSLEGIMRSIPEPQLDSIVQLYLEPGSVRLKAINACKMNPRAYVQVSLSHLDRCPIEILLNVCKKFNLFYLYCSITAERKLRFTEALRTAALGTQISNCGLEELLYDYITAVTTSTCLLTPLRRLCGDELVSELSLLRRKRVNFVPYPQHAKDAVFAFLVSHAELLKDVLSRNKNLAIRAIQQGFSVLPDRCGSFDNFNETDKNKFFYAIYKCLFFERDLRLEKNEQNGESQQVSWPLLSLTSRFVLLSVPYLHSGVIIVMEDKEGVLLVEKLCLCLIDAHKRANSKMRYSISEALLLILGHGSACRAQGLQSPAIKRQLRSVETLWRVRSSLLADSGEFSAAFRFFLEGIKWTRRVFLKDNCELLNLHNPELVKMMLKFIATQFEKCEGKEKSANGEPYDTLLKRALLRHIWDIAHLNPAGIAALLVQWLPNDQQEFISELKERQCKGLLSQGSGTAFSLDVEKSTDKYVLFTYLDTIVKSGCQSVLSNTYIQELYIENLCCYFPEQVYTYVFDNDGKITYDPRKVAQYTRHSSTSDACLFVLQKMGFLDEFFTFLHDRITAHLTVMRKALINYISSKSVAATPSEIVNFIIPSVRVDDPNAGTSSALPSVLLCCTEMNPEIFMLHNDIYKMLNASSELFVQHGVSEAVTNMWVKLLYRFMEPFVTCSALATRLKTLDLCEISNDFSSPNSIMLYDAVNELDIKIFDTNTENLLLSNVSASWRSLASFKFLEAALLLYSHYTSKVLNLLVQRVPLRDVLIPFIRDHADCRPGSYIGILHTLLQFQTDTVELRVLSCEYGDTDIQSLIYDSIQKREKGLTAALSRWRCAICQCFMKASHDLIYFYACSDAVHARCCGGITEDHLQRCPVCYKKEKDGKGYAKASSTTRPAISELLPMELSDLNARRLVSASQRRPGSATMPYSSIFGLLQPLLASGAVIKHTLPAEGQAVTLTQVPRRNKTGSAVPIDVRDREGFRRSAEVSSQERIAQPRVDSIFGGSSNDEISQILRDTGLIDQLKFLSNS